jgi:excisionase family DNA binding protein
MGRTSVDDEAATSLSIHLVSATEMASVLRIGRSTVLKWARTGVLPSYRIGGVVRFDPTMVMAAVRSPQAKETP